MDTTEIDARYRPAALEALGSFPVTAERLDPVGVSENVSYRVTVTGSDMVYALRLHRPGYNSLEELNSERAWITALGDAGLAVQKPLRTHDGLNFVLVDIPATGEKRYAGMTTWLDGEVMADLLERGVDSDERKRLFRATGELAARLHNQATTWTLPPGFCRHRLDIDGLLGEAPFWGRFWEHTELTADDRALLLRARKKVRNALEAYGQAADIFGLTHSDLHDGNLIVNGDDLALIDFDDTAFGWHLYDIASALVEYAADADYPALEAALLDGYRQHRSLAQVDVDMLPTFLLVRGMAIIGWYHERPEHTGSAYFEHIKNWVLGECAANES